jgi:uncharacterized protein YjbI with pentapeptide repeats
MLRARSVPEEHVYIELHPCEKCGSPLWTYTHELDVDGPRMTSRFDGKCKMCGAPRAFEFDMTGDAVSDTDPRRFYGGPEPSELVDPGEWLIIADKRAKVAPSSPDGLAPAALAAARGAMLEAAAAVEEARKFIPAGATEVPASAFRSDKGRAVHAAEPGRFRDFRLEAVAQTYAKILGRFAGPAGPRFGAGELGPIAERVNAARARAPRPRQAAASIDFRPGTYTDHLSRQVAAAHSAWVARGRTGDGRLVVSRAKLTGAPASGSTIPAARFESCKMTQANFSMSRMPESELIDCLCDETSFARSDLDGSLFERCAMMSADLRLARLRGVRIVQGDWGLSRLDRAALENAQVEDVDLQGAMIWDATLDRTLFVDCDLRGADLSRREPRLQLCSTTETWFIRCDLRGARLEGRRLAGTVFDRCKLAGVQGKPVVERPITILSPDLSPAGDGSDVRSADAVLSMWR